MREIPTAAERATAETEEQILQRQLASARAAFQEGRYDLSRDILREVPDPADVQVLYLQAQIALAQGDPVLATFYLKRIEESGPEQLETGQNRALHRTLADLSYETGDLDQAYRYYLQTVNLSGNPVSADIWLRLAEIALFRRSDAEAARNFLLNYRSSVGAQRSQSESSRLLDRLSRRLRWNTLAPEQFGLVDANISALQADGDDLWIGTWNGGICRYSQGRQESTVFESGGESLIPRTVRSIEVSASRVWIGTYQGLFQYTKSSSRWQRIPFFDEKVEALCWVEGTLYVGTLGRGLWRSVDGGWERIGWGGLPGDFINCLVASGDHLLIGTLNLGLVILNLTTERIHSFDSLNPNLAARNVISLLVEDDNTLWIGTYGEGLYRWRRQQNTIEHFSRASGHIADDWVLSAQRAESGLYFGTFGGGVSRYLPEEDSWQRIGLSQGLAALDISTVTYTAPHLFFGTLGSGISVLDESLVQDHTSGIK
ncbi:MAG: hypothetical protein JSV89_07045 [Spirochaetaceae bacterium]|nr:MAG: hypothetical protein JSV89_07045 [Spirochaetaceae bacterium]